MSFETALQAAIYDLLSADTAISSLVAGVYDDVPQGSDTGSSADFPYITIGEAVHTAWDTDTSRGDDASITVHVWSRYPGRAETKQIQGAIYDALHRSNLAVTGYATVGVDWEQSESFLDTDGETRHGVQTFRILLDEI